jgi:hypothetical protein
MTIGLGSQPMEFSLDVPGRYVCNSFDEELARPDVEVLLNGQPVTIFVTDPCDLSKALKFGIHEPYGKACTLCTGIASDAVFTCARMGDQPTLRAWN